jgi:hypothetical protein
MTHVVISFDTELSLAQHQRGVDPRANFESSILGRCQSGDFGVGWQMDQLEAHGLTGVFFVDPLPALLYGPALIADIVTPICARGHEVQLHLHTEWLQWASPSPVNGRTGAHLRDFLLDDQRVLLALASELLVAAGAPRPIAFRAGNYGADDNSLIALEALGFKWDSSFNADYAGGACRIGIDPARVNPLRWLDMTELPISGLEDRPGHFRPAQVCALSSGEMQSALSHAAGQNQPVFSVVCHSFEMLSRDRLRPNRLVMARFKALCRAVAADPRLQTSGFANLELAPDTLKDASATRLPANRMRTLRRQLEQALGTLFYDRQLRPL